MGVSSNTGPQPTNGCTKESIIAAHYPSGWGKRSMKVIKETGSKYRIEIDEGPYVLVYSIHSNKERLLMGEVHKDYPGWKGVWLEILGVLMDTVKVLEGGTGLQSRAFQQNSLN